MTNMYIKELELKDFRNYEDLHVSFSEDVNIFLGENAQGKTNLLEGIYLNAVARSFKTSRDREMIRFGESWCKVRAVSHYDDDDHVSEIVISREGAKAVRVDGVKISRTSELLDRLHIIVFSPEDLKIVKDEPGKRRGFINRELCQIRPGYVNDLNEYNRILKQRNAYLREETIDDTILDIWDDSLVRAGARIVRERRRFIEKIDEISREIHRKISGGKENLTLSYESDVLQAAEGIYGTTEINQDPGEFKETHGNGDQRSVNKSSQSHEGFGISGYQGREEAAFEQMLRKYREKDRLHGSTRKGPHHDDIKIAADGVDLRRFGSQGQQRTAALSLKLSEIRLIEEETGDTPILLLDDVLSELDNERQKYLISSLGDNQMFITTTDLIGSVARELPEGKVYKIKAGEIDIEI